MRPVNVFDVLGEVGGVGGTGGLGVEDDAVLGEAGEEALGGVGDGGGGGVENSRLHLVKYIIH